jgi:hypothetical protein
MRKRPVMSAMGRIPRLIRCKVALDKLASIGCKNAKCQFGHSLVPKLRSLGTTILLQKPIHLSLFLENVLFLRIY